MAEKPFQLSSTITTNSTPTVNNYDTLPTDVKLYILSFLGIRDAIAVTSVNRTNRGIKLLPRFWTQRIHRDLKIPAPTDKDAKQFYIDVHQKQIIKIRDLRFFTAGIDNIGRLYLLDAPFRFNKVDHDKQSLLRIAKFAEQHKLIDIAWSAGGSSYLLTQKGLFGFGNNYYNQLGQERSQYDGDTIVLLVPSTDKNKLIRFAYGMHFTVVQTQKELWIAGNVFNDNNNTLLKLDISHLDIVNIHCSYHDCILQFKDNTLISLVTFIKERQQGLRIPRNVSPYFRDKEIIKMDCNSENVVVWCRDGIYSLGNIFQGTRLFRQSNIEQFYKLDFFNTRKVLDIYMDSIDGIYIRCSDGVYDINPKNVKKFLATHLDHQISSLDFCRLDLQPESITNIKSAGARIFIELDGKWMSHQYVKSTSDDVISYASLAPANFIQIEENAPSNSISRCSIC